MKREDELQCSKPRVDSIDLNDVEYVIYATIILSYTPVEALM